MDPHRGPDHRRSSAPSLAVLGIGLLIFVTGCAGPGGAARGAASPAPTPVAASNLPPVTSFAPVGATETARVVRVVDGDTIVIDRGRGDERVRYIGMDTPECVKPNTPVEFMAKEASAVNGALVDGQDVVLERDVSDTDRFDRLLRYVWLRNAAGWLFVNLELVRQGYAQVATYPPDVRWTDELREAEAAARDAGVGLWGAPP